VAGSIRERQVRPGEWRFDARWREPGGRSGKARTRTFRTRTDAENFLRTVGSAAAEEPTPSRVTPTRSRAREGISRRTTTAGAVRFDVRYRDGRGREAPSRTRTFTDERAAQRFLEDHRRRRDYGAFAEAEPSREVISEYLLEWLEHGQWADDTLRGYKDAVRVVVRHLPVRTLAEFGPDAAHTWWASVRREYAHHAPMANLTFRAFSSALGTAVKRGKLPRNPLSGYQQMPVQRGRPAAYLPEEVERIRHAMPEPRDRAITSAMAYYGLRPAEALALRPTDLIELPAGARIPGLLEVRRSWTRGHVLKDVKNLRIRDVRAYPSSWEDLRSWADTLDPRCEWMFTTAYDAYSPEAHLLDHGNWFNRVWEPACERAGVLARRYDMRHSFSSLLINANESVAYVASQIGDDMKTVLDNYVHLFDRARLSPNVPVEDAIADAKRRVWRV
jgi:integrase